MRAKLRSSVDPEEFKPEVSVEGLEITLVGMHGRILKELLEEYEPEWWPIGSFETEEIKFDARLELKIAKRSSSCLLYQYEIILNGGQATVAFNSTFGAYVYLNPFDDDPPNLTITTLNNGAQVIDWNQERPTLAVLSVPPIEQGANYAVYGVPGDISTVQSITLGPTMVNKRVVMLPPGGSISVGDPNNLVLIDQVFFGMLGCPGDTVTIQITPEATPTQPIELSFDNYGQWAWVVITTNTSGGQKGYFTITASASNQNPVFIDGIGAQYLTLQAY